MPQSPPQQQQQDKTTTMVAVKSLSSVSSRSIQNLLMVMCYMTTMLLVVSTTSSVVSAFSVTTTTRRNSIHYKFITEQRNKQVKNSNIRHQSLFPQLNMFIDPNHITDTVVTTTDVPLLLSSFHTLIADASVATAADVVAVTKTGWWASYLNIFKGGLELIHTTINQPLKNMGIENTWGISIAVFTASIRLALVPLSLQQSKGAEYTKALRPYTKEINEKFADNEQAKARALSKLYEDAKQNPLSGCLLSLAQLPVFLGLYRGVRLLALDGELKEPFLWIPSLEGPVTAESDFRGLDWLTANWVDGVPSLGWETTIAFLIMPAVLVLLQSITMQTLQPPMDESMSQEEQDTMKKTQNVLLFLPLLIGFFSLQVPAGLTIYWFTSNIFTLSQSLVVKAYYAANPPKIELPDYWDTALTGDVENMTPDERRKASEAGISLGPTFDELKDQAKFHVYVERMNSFRTNLDNNTKNQQGGLLIRSSSSENSDITIRPTLPKDLEEWVSKSNPILMKSGMNTVIKVEGSQNAHPSSVAS